MSGQNFTVGGWIDLLPNTRWRRFKRWFSTRILRRKPKLWRITSIESATEPTIEAAE